MAYVKLRGYDIFGWTYLKAGVAPVLIDGKYFHEWWECEWLLGPAQQQRAEFVQEIVAGNCGPVAKKQKTAVATRPRADAASGPLEFETIAGSHLRAALSFNLVGPSGQWAHGPGPSPLTPHGSIDPWS